MTVHISEYAKKNRLKYLDKIGEYANSSGIARVLTVIYVAGRDASSDHVTHLAVALAGVWGRQLMAFAKIDLKF